MVIHGHYLDGKTSKRVEARLEVDAIDSKKVHIHLDHKSDYIDQITLPISELDIASRLGNTPREIAFEQGQLFVTEDNDAVDRLSQQTTETAHGNWLYKLESRLSMVIAATVLTLVFIWATIVYGIPAAAKFIAHEMPSFATEKLGSSLDVLDNTLLDPTTLEAQRQQQVLDLVMPYVDQYPELDASIHFRSGLGPNALALPGGEIVFTDDFIRMTQNDEQILAVLFHELGHLKHKHLARRVLQDAMVTLMVIFITGDVDTVDLVTGIPTLVLDLAYSRDFETEADIFALEQLKSHQLPVEAFASVMQLFGDYQNRQLGDAAANEKSEERFELPGFLSTHPATDDRVELVNEFKLNHSTQ